MLTKKFTYEEVVKAFEDKDLKLVTKKYENRHQKLTGVSKEGYKIEITMARILSTTNLRFFHIVNPYTIYNIKKYIENNKIKTKLLSETYESADNELVWECECGEKFKRTWTSFYHQNAHKCLKCSNKVVIDNKRLSFKKVEDLFKEKNLTLLIKEEDYKNKNQPLDAMTKEGYKVSVTVSSMRNNDYAIIHKGNPYTIYNINRYLELNNINLKLLSKKYINNNTDLKWQCCCGENFYRKWDVVRGQQSYLCKKCCYEGVANKNRKGIDDAKQILKSKGLKLITPEEKFVNRKQPIIVEDCFGYKFKTTIQILLKNNSDIFNPKNPFTIENIKRYLILNNISTTLISNKYIGRNRKLKWKCTCGREFERSLSSFIENKAFCCRKCSRLQSKNEKKTEDFLSSMNIKYETEKTFEGCVYKNKLRFDFYIEEFNLLIEVDGELHYFNRGHFKNLEEQQIRDEIKNKYCKDNNINLLRIPYWEYEEKERYKDLIIDKIKTLSHGSECEKI